MKVVYVAHQLSSGNRDQNRKIAADWCGWIADTFNCATVADWIILTGVWTEGMREKGLATDLELISRCDELWLVGPSFSSGMKLEAAEAEKLAKKVRNFVGMSRDEVKTLVDGFTDNPTPFVYNDYWVNVCSNCLTASCWHHDFMCEKAIDSSIVQRKATELVALGREDVSHFSREKIQRVEGLPPKNVDC